MIDQAALTSQLERQYCPPLDPPTLLAILSDFDVTTIEGLKAARQTLNSLTDDVEEEETSGFDPSGSSGIEGSKSSGGDESESGRSSLPCWSTNTDETTMSQGMSALDLEGLDFSDPAKTMSSEIEGRDSTPKEVYNAQWEGLDVAGREAVLMETFPGLKPFDIKWAVNKFKGNAGLVIDDLLHQVFMEENGIRHRGIEAFSESELPERPWKGKKKKKSSILTSDASSSSVSGTPTSIMESKWDSARKDIEFITSNTGLPMTQVSSMYHAHGASIPSTLNAIIDAHLALSIEATEPMIDVNASDLNTEFPTIPLARALVLVELTHPSTAAAHKLAKALTTHPSRISAPFQIEIRLPPPDLDNPAPKTKPHNADFATPAPASPNDPDYFALQHAAFTQARVAHRISKSNPLMGGAASYYSQLGRDYSVRAAAQTSAAADAHVASQSSGSILDLHGVSVKDGVRIAREHVTSWWAGKRGVEPGRTFEGYKIVTGKGTHSKGGRSKLGPAVGGMLIREGWKVQIGSGAVVVTGVARDK